MSTPYSLAEAFELLKKRQERPKSNNHAIDILGIVSNISNSAPLPGRSGVRKCQIWLVDESLGSSTRTSESNQRTVRFVLFDSSETTRITKENIKMGDILRFNNVTLKSFRGSSQFQFSSLDPEPGLSWFRLGSVDDPIIYTENDIHASPQNSIPKSMMTSKERVVELANWYTNTRTTRLPPCGPRGLPTRKRNLDELQSSVGLLSNITVRLMCVRILPATSNSNYRYGNRRNTRQRPPLAFASFVDESGATMSFIDSSGRFLSTLKIAEKDNKTTRLMVTNVSTACPSQPQRGLATSANEIVLVPTDKSTMRVISDEKPLDESKKRKPFAHHLNQPSTQEMLHDTDFVVHAGISDMFLNGISFKTSPFVFASSSTFLTTIRDKNDGTFRGPLIYLDQNEGQVGNEGLLALPSVLKTLCGSLDIAELSNHEILCTHSMNLLQALLQEDTILEWTLRKEKTNLMIVKVTLHRLSS